MPYFATGQKFIARKGVLKTPEDIKKRIGADKGTVQEITLRERFPTAKVISYDDTRWRLWRCVTATCRRSPGRRQAGRPARKPAGGAEGGKFRRSA